LYLRGSPAPTALRARRVPVRVRGLLVAPFAGEGLDRAEVVGRRVEAAGHGYNDAAVPAGATGSVLPPQRGRIRI